MVVMTTSGASGIGGTPFFEEDFEGGIDGWLPFEHIIDDGSCYGEDLGTIEFENAIAHSSGNPTNGTLKVTANSVGNSESNHMLGIYPIDPGPVTGGIMSLGAWVQVPSESLTSGQTGPEFGIQSHFVNPASGFLTDEAALQYVISPSVADEGDALVTFDFDTDNEGWIESGTNTGSTLSHTSDAQNNIGDVDGTDANVTVHPSLNAGGGVASSQGGGFVGEFDESANVEGKNFWILFQNNYDDNQVETLFVAGLEGTEVFIDGASRGTIDSSELMEINVDRPMHEVDEIVTDASLNLTADAAVTVFGYNNRDFSDDAFTVFPVDALGMSYTAVGSPNDIVGDAYVSQISVLATEADTSVTIGATNITLDTGESYTLTSDVDLTGTKITSDKPIGAWSGRRCLVGGSELLGNIRLQNGNFCAAGLFQVVNGQLKILDPTTGTYIDIGPDYEKYNATGYRMADGYAYGYATANDAAFDRHDLLRIDVTNGDVTSLGPLGFTTNHFVGDIDNDTDTYYVSTGKNEWKTVDIENVTATDFPLASADGSSYVGGADMAIVDDTAYLMKGNTLTTVDLTAQTFTSTFVADAPTSGTFGAAWITEDDTLYFGLNKVSGANSGEIWRIDNYTTATPSGVRVSSVPSTNSNDGFGCPTQEDPLPDPGGCDIATEMLIPDASSGTEYFVPSVPDDHYFRVVATEDDTEVRVDGVLEATLDEGEYYEQDGSGVYVNTTKRAVAYVIVKGTDGGEDPSFLLLPGWENAVRETTFSAINNPTNPFTHTVSVVIDNGHVANLLVDGAAPTDTTVTAFGISGKSQVDFEVDTGAHTITTSSNREFIVTAYGTAVTESYAYVAGLAFPTGENPVEEDGDGSIRSPNLGDLSGSLGGDLSFEFWNWAGDGDDGFGADDYKDSVRVSIHGANGTTISSTISLDKADAAAGLWQDMTIGLDKTGGWRTSDGDIAGMGIIQGVLNDVEWIDIGTETIIGFDTGAPTTQTDDDAERWAVDNVVVTAGGARWQIWTDIGDDQVGWVLVPEMDIVLAADVWYEVELVADFDNDAYESLRVTGNSEDKTVDITDLVMETDVKETVQGIGTWATMETENFWTDCASVQTSATYYDDIDYSFLTEPPPIAPPNDKVSDVFTNDVAWVIVSGVSVGCSNGQGNFCASEKVTRGQMATFIARSIGLTGEPENPFSDISGHAHEWNIRRVAAAGISLGCGNGDKFCPDSPVSRGQMATFLTRAFELALDPEYSHTFGDVDDQNVHEKAIATLAQHGISSGCGNGLNFCPDDTVTREQMAAFLHRAVSISNELFGTGAPVTLYTDRGWVGNVYLADDGTHTAADLNVESMNNVASSIRVTDGYEATVCSGNGGSGTCAVLTASVADLNAFDLGDRISWVDVRKLP